MGLGIGARVEGISQSLALTHDELAGIVGSTPRTVSRWVSGASTPQRLPKERLLQLDAVAEMLKGVLRPEVANLWLSRPNKLLDWDTPAERIAKGGFRDVLSLIEALADGVSV
ncbi:MAG: antitoxin Xre/MbcA/ParS toxin-binding domain-containing protein [Dehalococcoidia bacterium]